MERKKTMLGIIILILIIIMIIVVLLVYIDNNQSDKKELEKQDQTKVDVMNNPGKIIEGVIPSKTQIPNIYFSIEKVLKQYLEYVAKKDINAIYGLLDYKYINENNINTANVLEYVSKHNSESSTYIKEMYEISGDKYSSYYINYLEQNENYYITINMDTSSESFSVIPMSEEKYKKIVLEPAKAFGNNEDTVKRNEYNEFSFIYLTTEEIVQKYFENYKNKNSDTVGNLDRYTVMRNDDGTTEYTCTDDNGKTYTFKINAVMDYTVNVQ